MSNMVVDEDGNVRPAATPPLLPMEGRGAFLGFRETPQGKELALPGIVAGLINSTQTPGRAWQGQASPEESAEFGMNFGAAGLGTAGKAAFAAAKPGVMNSFFGLQGATNLRRKGRLSAEALRFYKDLQDQLDKGLTFTKAEADEIWRATKKRYGFGFDVGFPDHAVRGEIDPRATWIDTDKLPSSKADIKMLDDVVKNPTFYEAYPELSKKGILQLSDDPSYAGMMEPSIPRMQLREETARKTPLKSASTAEHELTHYPEHIEGFAHGGTSEATMSQELRKRVDAFKRKSETLSTQAFFKIRNEVPDVELKAIQNYLDGDANSAEWIAAVLDNPFSFPQAYTAVKRFQVQHPKLFKAIQDSRLVSGKLDELTKDAYYRLGGEQAANLAQHRRTFSSKQLDEVRPSSAFEEAIRMNHRHDRDFTRPQEQYLTDWKSGTTVEQMSADIARQLREFAKDPNK